MGCCKTPKYTFSANLVGLVGAGWQPPNTPEILVFRPLGPPTTSSFNFFDHHCKGNAFTDIFVCKVCFQRVAVLSHGPRDTFGDSLAQSLQKLGSSNVCRPLYWLARALKDSVVTVKKDNLQEFLKVFWPYTDNMDYCNRMLWRQSRGISRLQFSRFSTSGEKLGKVLETL